jgi:ATP-dependent Clp protease ATP-binding subunit ClpC
MGTVSLKYSTNMFERYTENARRAIFFARYEASHLDSAIIEPEHLLLALLRESTGLTYRLLRSSPALADEIRSDIEAHITTVEKTSSSVDLPLASEEAEKLISAHIHSEHLLLGILREETSFAAGLLREHGLTLDFVREKAKNSGDSAG